MLFIYFTLLVFPHARDRDRYSRFHEKIASKIKTQSSTLIQTSHTDCMAKSMHIYTFM